MKILTLPFAGGSRYSFNFPKDVINVLEYPGRGSRINEPLKFKIEEVVDDIYEQLKDYFDQDYILYGHSMGGLVAYLVCKKVEQNHKPKPEKLIVSGCKAPSIKRKELLHKLPGNLFWQKIADMGGIPDEILQEKELRAFFEPVIRADFKCIETYEYKNDFKKLTTPIDVFYGSEEDITEDEIKNWRVETNQKVNFTKLEGDHFFIYNHVNFLTNYFRGLLLV